MLLPLKRYFEFSGRSRRKEYWMFVLFTVTASVVLGIIDELLGLKFDGSGSEIGDNGVIGSLFSIATLVPGLTVAVRRLHDTNRSAWWMMLPFGVLVVGLVVVGATSGYAGETGGAVAALIVMGVVGLCSFLALIVFFCLDGTRGPNRFGDDPKGVGYDGVFD